MRAALLLIFGCATTAQVAAQSPAARLSRRIDYYNPDWSPNGRSLVFESTLAGVYSIYAIGADGSGLRRLTADTSNNEQARWSRDGMRIVFSSDRAGHLDLYLMNPDGSGQVRLTTTSGGGYYQASFSPDGKWIAFQGRPDNGQTRDRVFVVASDGTGFRQVTDSSFGAEGPKWSSDGKSIRFLQVPYPKRLWSEMQPGDMDIARAGQRMMSVRPDGSGLTPLGPVAQSDSGGVPSPDGRRRAYAKSVDGWSGLYAYDVGPRTERLLTGGAGAGPLGYLRTTSLVAGTDTFDTYTSTHGGPIERGNGAYVVRSARQISGRRWELSDNWLDTTGRVTARQSVRTARGSLATELETVRATGDSASLLVTPDRVTAWVVPQGQPPRLFDAPATGERYTEVAVIAAIAKSKPAIGAVFVAPASVLYGPNPTETRVDSIRVVRRDTLYRGSAPVPVVVLERPSGTQIWADETTGDEVASRGDAGPTRWWWHIRRGVRMSR